MKCNYLLISYTIITFDGDVYNKKKLIRFRNILLHDCQTQYDRLVFTVEKHICIDRNVDTSFQVPTVPITERPCYLYQQHFSEQW